MFTSYCILLHYQFYVLFQVFCVLAVTGMRYSYDRGCKGDVPFDSAVSFVRSWLLSLRLDLGRFIASLDFDAFDDRLRLAEEGTVGDEWGHLREMFDLDLAAGLKEKFGAADLDLKGSRIAPSGPSPVAVPQSSGHKPVVIPQPPQAPSNFAVPIRTIKVEINDPNVGPSEKKKSAPKRVLLGGEVGPSDSWKSTHLSGAGRPMSSSSGGPGPSGSGASGSSGTRGGSSSGPSTSA